MTIGRTTDPISFFSRCQLLLYSIVVQASIPRLIGLPRDGIIGASWCRRLKGKEEEEEEWLRRGQAKGASALFFYAPRWPQTTELNQLKFNPEPGGSRRSPPFLPSLLFFFFLPPISSPFVSPFFRSPSSLLFLPAGIFSIFSIYIFIYSFYYIRAKITLVSLLSCFNFETMKSHSFIRFVYVFRGII